MKKTIFFCLLALQVAAGFVGASPAAAAVSAPVVTVGMGYWNVETNVSQPFTTVRFFNAQHRLVYEERAEGLRLNLTHFRPARRRAILILDQALVQLQPQAGCPQPAVARML